MLDELLSELKAISLVSNFFCVFCLEDVLLNSAYALFVTALSVRLGLGKGGVRMAPEESLHAVLQVFLQLLNFAAIEVLCGLS